MANPYQSPVVHSYNPVARCHAAPASVLETIRRDAMEDGRVREVE